MLYIIYQFLDINILQYISFRAGIGFFISFFLTIFIIPKYIKWILKNDIKQPISKYVPIHNKKKNTPTMGGLSFIVPTLIAILLTARLDNNYIIIAVFLIVGFTTIGLIDDIDKVRKNSNAGLSSKKKFLFLFILSSIISLSLLFFTNLTTDLYSPFIKNPILDLGFYMPLLWIFIFVATTNAVNLTDGLDGLATIPSVISIFTLGVIIYITGDYFLSNHLLLPYIVEVGEVMIVAASLSGGLLGFLWYNCYPAELFMGDAGSLTIGGVIAYLAILGKSEILLILIGGIFVIETVTVILQLIWKRFLKRKLFLVAPVHHHFEKL